MVLCTSRKLARAVALEAPHIGSSCDMESTRPSRGQQPVRHRRAHRAQIATHRVVVVATTGAAMGDAREDDPRRSRSYSMATIGKRRYAAGAIDAVLLFANAFRLNAAPAKPLVGEHPKAAKCLLPKPGSSEPAAAVEPQILRKTLVGAGQMIMAEAAGGRSSAARRAALCRSAARRDAAAAAARARAARVARRARPAPARDELRLCREEARRHRGRVVLAPLAADGGRRHRRPLPEARHGGARRPRAVPASACLPDQHARQIVRPPAQGKLETRALCYLTKQPVEIGHACSVCLTVFADPTALGTPPICPVCGERFVLKPVPKPPPKKKQRPPPEAPPQQVRTPRRAARRAAPPSRLRPPPPHYRRHSPSARPHQPARSPLTPSCSPSQDLSSAAAQAAKEKAEAEEAARGGGAGRGGGGAEQAEEEAARLAAEKAAEEEARGGGQGGGGGGQRLAAEKAAEEEAWRRPRRRRRRPRARR